MTTIPEDNWEMSAEVSPAALTISVVIAVALYVVTYSVICPSLGRGYFRWIEPFT